MSDFLEHFENDPAMLAESNSELTLAMQYAYFIGIKNEQILKLLSKQTDADKTFEILAYIKDGFGVAELLKAFRSNKTAKTLQKNRYAFLCKTSVDSARLEDEVKQLKAHIKQLEQTEKDEVLSAEEPSPEKPVTKKCRGRFPFFKRSNQNKRFSVLTNATFLPDQRTQLSRAITLDMPYKHFKKLANPKLDASQMDLILNTYHTIYSNFKNKEDNT